MPRRLTLDDADDYPFDWTADSKLHRSYSTMCVCEECNLKTPTKRGSIADREVSDMARFWANATVFVLAILFARFGQAQTQQQDLQLAVLPVLGPRSMDPRSSSRDVSVGDSTSSALVQKSVRPVPADRNRDIYYRNKLEFSLDGGWLPINIPFPLDVFVGDAYNTYPLKYTLVPIIASLRWHLDGVGSPWLLRGNWDLTCSGSITAIPRGPETRYFAYLMGIRRNFVPRNSKVAPYFDIRLGLGNIDAKGPQGVKYAQGEDFTFTVNMGSGVRYNFSPRYAISAGLNFMHISNLNLSQGNGKNGNWGIRNYGINVYGPMVGIDVRLGRPKKHSDVK